jgi:hypothetical protein
MSQPFNDLEEIRRGSHPALVAGTDADAEPAAETAAIN